MVLYRDDSSPLAMSRAQAASSASRTARTITAGVKGFCRKRVTVTSSYQADVETTVSRDMRTAGGAAVGERSTAAPLRFTLDR
jgi:hypothetical protein